VYYWPQSGRYSPIPWRVALFGIIGLGIFNALGLWNGVIDSSFGTQVVRLRNVLFLFHPSTDFHKEVLIGVASGIIFCGTILLLLAPCMHYRAWEINYGPQGLWFFLISTIIVLEMTLLPLSLSKAHRITALPTAVAIIAACVIVVAYFTGQEKGADEFSALYRSAHITSGVSPTLPLLLMLAAMYISTMLSLRVSDLLGSAPVRLPRALFRKSKSEQRQAILPWIRDRLSLSKAGAPTPFLRLAVLVFRYGAGGKECSIRENEMSGCGHSIHHRQKKFGSFAGSQWWSHVSSYFSRMTMRSYVTWTPSLVPCATRGFSLNPVPNNHQLKLGQIAQRVASPMDDEKRSGINGENASTRGPSNAGRIGTREQRIASDEGVAGGGSGPVPAQLYQISAQFGRRLNAYVVPLSGGFLVWFTPLVVTCAALSLIWPDASSLTLEGPRYSYTLLCCIAFAGTICMGQSLKVYECWINMRLMLRALGRQRLRRTFAALRKCPEASIWALGSGARGEQIRGLSNQVDSLSRLYNLLDDVPADLLAKPAIEACIKHGTQLMVDYASGASRRDTDKDCNALRPWIGRASEDVINWILAPAWGKERESLNLETKITEKSYLGNDDDPHGSEDVKLSQSARVTAAEEFICQHYITYIKTLLSCLRCYVKSIALLFLAMGAAISVYPILSRTTIVLALLITISAVFIVIARVFVGMTRDEILSLITRTTPGELGTEFWIKLIGFGLGPAVGLIAAQFPAFAETVLSVLSLSVSGPK
jgi:hypothetical protein